MIPSNNDSNNEKKKRRQGVKKTNKKKNRLSPVSHSGPPDFDWLGSLSVTKEKMLTAK